MRIINKFTDNVFVVFDIKEENDKIYFLIYNGNKFAYVDSEFYKPHDENLFAGG